VPWPRPRYAQTMKAARSRFTRRATLVLVGTVAAAAGIAVIVVVLLLGTPASDTAPLVAVIAVVALLLGLGAPSTWNAIGLIRISRLKPDALVFLARREPTLAPDLPMYLHRKDIAADVSDRWLAAVIDDRGMAAWSGGFRPRELVLMEWSEIGDVIATGFRSLDGSERFGITVDVRPFPTPLVVRVGYAMFGLQAAFDRAGTIAVNEAANAKRPVREPS
jgi:hypothetical protein